MLPATRLAPRREQYQRGRQGRARTTTMHRCVLRPRHRQLLLILVARSLHDRVRDILDADREDERLDVVLLAPYQREELREVARVHRLPQSQIGRAHV